MSRYGVRDVAAIAAFVPHFRTSGRVIETIFSVGEPGIGRGWPQQQCRSEVSYEDAFTGWRRRVRLVLVRRSRNRGQIDGLDSYDPSSHSCWKFAAGRGGA